LGGGDTMTVLTTNRYTNPSFESASVIPGFSITVPDGAGLYVNGASGAVDAETGDANSTGDTCASITATTDGHGGYIYILDTTVGASVFSVNVWLTSGATDWDYQLFTEAFAELSALTPFTPAAGVQRITVPFVTIANPTALRLYLVRSSTAASEIRIDAVQLELGTVATDYFDGSLSDTATINYAWTGTAHESTSTRTDDDDGYDLFQLR
jgi:hypothetical protein